MDESRAGAFIATVAGSYSHQVQLVQSGSLSATFYSDAGFGTPVLTSQAASSLGDLSDPLIQVPSPLSTLQAPSLGYAPP